MAISITKPVVGGSQDTWGETLNTALDTIVDGVNGTSGTVAPDLSTLKINGTELNNHSNSTHKSKTYGVSWDNSLKTCMNKRN